MQRGRVILTAEGSGTDSRRWPHQLRVGGKAALLSGGRRLVCSLPGLRGKAFMLSGQETSAKTL